MKRVFIALAMLSSTAAWSADGDTKQCAEMLAIIGEPDYKSASDEGDILCRSGYVLSHNDERLTPDWVLENLRPERFTGPANRKKLKDPFATDPDLKQLGKTRAELSDYRGKGYDRGHMAPAADMKYSTEAMTESFYLSNMAPQVGIGLNRHIWADLEALVRHWTCDRGHVVAITGPIYERERPKTIGDNKVAVPDGFYKIVYDVKSDRAIAFILPNQRINTAKLQPEEALKPYIVTVREIEQKTGLDFFTAFMKRKQDRVEQRKSAMWPVRSGCNSKQVLDN